MSGSSDNRDAVGRVPPRGERANAKNAASGDAAYNQPRPVVVGRVPPRGERAYAKNAASGDAAYNQPRPVVVGRVPPRGVPVPPPDQPRPRRMRRLHRVWPDRDGSVSYLLTICVDGRAPVLNNETTFERFGAFLLDSPQRYHWFGRRFVVMPDHIHLIAHMVPGAVRLGQWIKALKAVVGGLKQREECPVGAPGLQGDVLVGRVPSHGVPMPTHGERANVKDAASGDAAYNNPRPDDVGRVPSHGVPTPTHGERANVKDAASGDAAYNNPRPDDVGRVPPRGVPAPPHGGHEFTRAKRSWRWQDGFHDHKFRTPESESRKWEYVCLNPVRYGLVQRPEEWPFGGEIFYDEAGGPRLIRCTPPLLETGVLMAEETPREDTRPTSRPRTVHL